MAETDKNKAKKVVPIIIDGFEINAPKVTFQKLQEFSLTLYGKLLHQRKVRNCLLLERDKLRTILENTQHEIKVANDVILNKDEELEQLQTQHRRELKDIEEEVKFIFYNHQLDLSRLDAWEDTLLGKRKEANLAEELELLSDKRRLKEKLFEENNNFEEEVVAIKENQAEQITNLSLQIEENQIKQETEFQIHLSKTVEHLQLKHEMEMSEIEERKNTHLAELKQIHNTRLDEMKHFFNSITAEHLSVTANMKQGLDGINRSKVFMMNEIKMLTKENNRLKLPLSETKARVNSLSKHLINYEKDLRCLKNNKKILKEVMEDTKKINKKRVSSFRKLREHEKSTADQTDTRFEMYAIRKRKHMEELLEKLIVELNKKQHILKILSSDPDVRRALQETNFEFWNQRKLSYELDVMCKAYDELLNTYGAKLKEFCLSEEELGFETLNERKFTSGPASLVSKQ